MLFGLLHFYKWVVVKDTGKHHYLECSKCGKRKIRVVRFGGFQPIDKGWINHA